MRLSIEDRMSLSQVLGSPVEDLLDKADVFIKRVEPIMRRTAEGPREAIIILAMAYVYFSIRYSVDQDDDEVIEKAKDFLDQIITLIYVLGDN